MTRKLWCPCGGEVKVHNGVGNPHFESVESGPPMRCQQCGFQWGGGESFSSQLGPTAKVLGVNSRTMIHIACVDCEVEQEVDSLKDVPVYCPECGSEIVRAKDPEQDDGTWKSHLE